MSLSPNDKPGLSELVGDLCNEALDVEGRKRLNDELADDLEAQKLYILYADLHAALRQNAQSLDDEEYALREAQAALDSLQQSCNVEIPASKVAVKQLPSGAEITSTESHIRRSIARWRNLLPTRSPRPVVCFTIAVLLLLSLSFTLLYYPTNLPQEISAQPSMAPSGPLEDDLGPAHLCGAVAARWAGEKLEIIEGEQFEAGQRLELVEGLAEVCFLSGARVILQGPAILQIHDVNNASVLVGRVAATLPQSDTQFTLRTAVATMTSKDAEYGVEVDVDGTLLTQVYSGVVQMKLDGDADTTPNLELVENQGLRIDAASGRVKQLDQASRLHFVRYLPSHEVLVNLADIVAGGNGLREGSGEGYHRGISLPNGKPVGAYGAPAWGDGKYHRAQENDLVDGVFIPNGKRGAVQIDSIGRTFAGFPPTTDECWGGVIMARRPKSETSLPFMRLEFHGETYGYVNWLHIASRPDELSPLGYGLIGMHSNCGITFDLHAIRAQNPNKKIVRFRALVGNLEAKQESHVADAWVLVDGQLRYSRKAFSREHGPEEIDVPLTDNDRFLVLAVTDSGEKTAYDWVAFGDPIIEITNKLDEVTASVATRHPEVNTVSWAEVEVGAYQAVPSGLKSVTSLIGGNRFSHSIFVSIFSKFFIRTSSYLVSDNYYWSLHGANPPPVDQSDQNRLAAYQRIVPSPCFNRNAK